MNSLPGFFPVGAPNAEVNVTSAADGSVEVVLLDNVSADCLTKGHQLRLLQVFGTTQSVVLDDPQMTDMLLILPGQAGLKRLVFRLRPEQLSLSPGNYVLQLLESGREVLRRSLTVVSRPRP